MPSTGELLEEFVKAGSGGLYGPDGLTFGPDGNGDGADDLYVSSFNTDSVLRYDGTTGDFIDDFITSGSGGLNGPRDLLFRTDGLLVASYIGDSVLRYDAATGNFLGEFVAANSGGLDGPTGLTFGPDGNGDDADDLYVSSYSTDSVLRYDGENGSFLNEFIPSGSDGLDGPKGLAFDSNGSLFVCSYNTDSLLHYATNGNFISEFGTTDDELDGPTGVILDSNGDLRVGSYNTDSVLRYQPDGTLVDTTIASGAELVAGRSVFTFGPDGDLYIQNSIWMRVTSGWCVTMAKRGPSRKFMLRRTLLTNTIALRINSHLILMDASIYSYWNR